MKAAMWLLLALFTVACASKRERRQSVYTAAQTAAYAQRDTAWHSRKWGAHSVYLVEVEEWTAYTDTPATDTIPAGSSAAANGGNIIPPQSNYRRTRSVTWYADSNTVTSGRSSSRDSLNTAATGRNTVTSERMTFGSICYIGVALLVVVLAMVVYRLVRRVYR